MSTQLWVDASAGVAGDMMLAALLDAGADIAVVRAAVDAVVPGEVTLAVERVMRAGISATRVRVAPSEPPGHDRSWKDLSALLREAQLAEPVRDLAVRAFAALARAEAAVHGVPEESVRFHEVGAWDSIADVVGVSAAVHALGVTGTSATAVGLGSGTVRSEHGTLPVPVPAVLRLLADGPVVAGDSSGLEGECATPTGLALLVALLGSGGPVQAPAPAPAGMVRAVGLGAGTRDTPGRANVVRVVVHEPLPGGAAVEAAGPVAGGAGSAPDGPVGHAMGAAEEELVEVAATVDDLDPRVWPSVIEELLAAGALDAWLLPVQMKKGRPGTVLHALARPQDREVLVTLLLRHTPTLGVRWHEVRRRALAREWRQVPVAGGTVRIKLGLQAGRVLTATPELEDCRVVARAAGRPLRHVLREAEAAAQSAGWGPGAAI